MIIHYFHLIKKNNIIPNDANEKIQTKKFPKKKLFSSFLRLLISLRNQYFLFIWRIKGLSSRCK